MNSKDLSKSLRANQGMDSKKDLIRFLAVGDLHGDVERTKKILEKARKENIDFLILTGDLTYFDQHPELIGKVLKDCKRPIYFIPGNHDSELTVEMLYRLFGLKPFHKGYFIKYYNAFVGFGFATVGPHAKTINEFYEGLNNIFLKLEQKSGLERIILITHEHPSDTKIDKFTPFFNGNPAIKAIIEKFQPELHICSHVHEAENIEDYILNTKIINVARSGKIFEIKLNTKNR